MTQETDTAHPSLTPLRAFVVLCGVAVALTGYLVLAHTLGIHAAFAGILIVFYLFAMEGGAVRALPKAFIGALGGMANGALFAAWPGLDPDLTAVAGLVAVLVAVYCLLIGFAPILFNQAYMLVLTVVCIPAVLMEADFTGMAAAMVLSLLYFGSILWVGKILGDRRANVNAGTAGDEHTLR